MSSQREKSPKRKTEELSVREQRKKERDENRCHVCPEFRIVMRPTGPNGEMQEKKIPYGMDADRNCVDCRVNCCPEHFHICSNCIQSSCTNCGKKINEKWYCRSCSNNKSVKKPLPFVRSKTSCRNCYAPRVKGSDGFCIRCGDALTVVLFE
jgi:hypothetical protein